MRTVSFVERLEFEYEGNLFCKALALGDVDNDKGNELVLGNDKGDLCIFKGTVAGPWRKCTDLGMITCVEVGDILNHGTNYIVSLSVEGWCHVIRIKSGLPTESKGDQEETSLDDLCRIIKPLHRQHLAANSKVLLIADIDNDGRNELVIAYSDRRVRAYRWTDDPEFDLFPTADGNQGRFKLVETWQLAGQIGSITVHEKEGGGVDLMASQPGGTYVTLYCSKRRDPREGSIIATNVPRPEVTKDEGSTDTSSDNSEDIEGPYLIYHPLGSSRAKNPSVTTEVVGNISRQKKEQDTYVPSYSAVCLLDGTITLVDGDKILWSLYVDQQLFTLTKLDVTGDGIEEVIACSWDGQTYIVDLSKEVVRFHFQENVAGFCAGHYAVEGNKNVPCFIYATFNNTIVVYYNVEMSHIGTPNLLTAMSERSETSHLLARLNIDSSNTAQMKELFQWCLYGMPQNGT